MSSEGFYVVIPARYASTRLPGKPLIELAGRAMVLRVAERARASGATEVIVATDHPEIVDVVVDAGFTAEMTSADHASGSDRIMEVVTRRGWPEDSVVVNVQGDEPLIPPTVIRQLGLALAANGDLGAATLCEPQDDLLNFADPNAVKVVRGAQQQALYFSRSPIPYSRDHAGAPARWLRHVGIYAYRVEVLKRFVGLTPSPLEQEERLEQLRLLENGIGLCVLDACEPVPAGVDTPNDVARVQSLLATR